MHISDFLTTDSLFDSHAHLTNLSFELEKDSNTNTDLDLTINTALESNVDFIFDMGVNIHSSKIALGNAIKYKAKVFAFVGIDPEIFIPGSDLNIGREVDDKWFDNSYFEIKRLITDNLDLIKGVGECGIDSYWLQKADKYTRERSIYLQERLFELHLSLAQEFNLPLSIHSRGAEEMCLNIIKKRGEIKGIFHSYTGSYELAKKILEEGWGLGINGIVTFKKADEIRGMYRKLIGKTSLNAPSDFYKKGFFFETDSPFLSPEGKRGEINQPSNVRIIFDKFIEILKYNYLQD